MSGGEGVLREFRREFLRFMMVMEELRFLRCVSEDLKSFRKMLKLKKFDRRCLGAGKRL